MATQNNLRIPDELFAELAAKAASEGKTVDAVAEDALRRHLARRSLDRFRREASARRGTMSEAQVDEIVEHAVRDVRSR